MPKGELESIRGIIRKIQAPSPVKNEEESPRKWRPASITIESEDDSFPSFVHQIAQFPKPYPPSAGEEYRGRAIEPIEMPDWYVNAGFPKQLDRTEWDNNPFIGREVRITAEIVGVRDGVLQWNSVKSFKFVKEAPPVTEKDAPEEAIEAPEEASDPKPVVIQDIFKGIDPNQLRIMRQSTLGYAATLLATKNVDEGEELVTAVINVARLFLDYVITGEMPGFHAEVEEDDDVVGTVL